MTEPTTGRHPDPDLLADLAAEVLPREQALAVEQHVLGCESCAGRLSASEGIRGLLRDDPVGPMPADVAARLDAALRKESLWASAQTVEAPAVIEPVAGRTTRRGRAEDGSPATGSLPQESFFDEPYPTAMIPAGSIPAASPASTSRLRRANRSDTQRTRRQVRDEERDTRPPWARPVFAVAAGLVGVLGVGVAIQQLGGSASDAASTSAGSAAGGSSAYAADAPDVSVLETGTDYTAAKLEAQAKALVGKAAAVRQAQDLAGGAATEPPAEAATPGPATRPATRSAADTGAANKLLKDPAALAACLSAIDSAGVRPLAVDLARYQGQEAAILVLPAPAGGIEVWAVSRTCKPGADGTLIFKSVK